MFAMDKIVLGMAVLQLVVAQDGVIYHPGSGGQFGLFGSGSAPPSPVFIGGPGQFPQVSSVSSHGSGSDGTTPGLLGVGVKIGLPPNPFSTFGGVSGQGGAGVVSLSSQQGPAVTGRGGVISLPSQQGPAFIGGQGAVISPPSQQGTTFTGQGGVISLPSQQGPAFIGGQGGSFISGQVSGQAGASGAGFQQGGVQPGGVQAAGLRFPSRVIREEATPTVTRTVTIDAFETLTDLVLHSVAVTRTQFSLVITTRVTKIVVPTPVNHGLALTTSVVVRPAYVTVTDTKSDFRVVLRTSVSYVTITHTSYDIMHVPFTLTSTETVTVTSPVVRTVISTSVEAVTNYHTATNIVYVHGGYH
ncbi:hypothetical protein O3P69_006508 [Scylla paramamosain]|uniref:Uncharacterized protein n=1 Tax=Scylla paramamosain TaxID=85552 RepID=A0AAW0U2Q1_SCYPA